MKIQVLILLLVFAASECFAQNSKSGQALSNVYHYGNNISIKNFDGSRSTIYVFGNSAQLINSDGTQSIIDFYGKSSRIIEIDGTVSTVYHNGFSSTVMNSDGSQFIVNHMHNSSTCFTDNGKHTIMHTFGEMKERRYKIQIDVLIHSNWLSQRRALESIDETQEQSEVNDR